MIRFKGGPIGAGRGAGLSFLVKALADFHPPYFCTMIDGVWHHYACKHWSEVGGPHGVYVYDGPCPDREHRTPEGHERHEDDRET